MAVNNELWKSEAAGGEPTFEYTLSCSAERTDITTVTFTWTLDTYLSGTRNPTDPMKGTHHGFTLTATAISGNSTESKQIKDNTVWYAGDGNTITLTTTANIGAGTGQALVSFAVTSTQGPSGVISSSFTVNVPKFNAPSPGTVSISKNQALKRETVTVSWSGFSSTNVLFQTITYRLDMYVNSAHKAIIFNGERRNSQSVNLSSYNLKPRDKVKFQITCWTKYDENNPIVTHVDSANIIIKAE